LPRTIERLAPAKINLALHVLGRRADLYHELDTLAVFADFGDRVAVSAADKITLSIGGPFAGHAPPGAENLALRAALRLEQKTGFAGGAAIRLDKHLPAGAGFGGGSADAAATLLALDELWGLSLGPEGLKAIGEALGADVAMCLEGRALRARGAGERIAPLRGWPPLPLVLVWPGSPVSTAAAFGSLTSRQNPPLPDPPAAPDPVALATWLADCRNDLEEPALRLASDVVTALARLRATPGCVLARMSGSGSGCFGLYPTSAEAKAAADALRQTDPDWWVQAAVAQ
jgi:4-diphosphocytidyl-2-C-methyl-D-erythritol kinase